MLDDAAQGFGASYKGRRLGTFGLATATSFFPAKPLGCYGDGGAIFTDDDALAETLRSIRVHGQGSDKYDNVRIGITGRLDTMQAAILIEKLKIFEDEIAARNAVAERYARGLGNVVTVPRLATGCTSVWAQYTIRLPKGPTATALRAALKAQGIPTAIYYPKSMHQQTAYRDFPVADGGLPVSERLSADVISLPMHAYLDEATQERIIEAVRGALSMPDFAVLRRRMRSLLEAAHARTHLHRRRIYAALAADRLCARHHARGDPRRRTGGGRVLRGAAAAQSFSRDLRRRRLQRRVRAGLCACARPGRSRRRKLFADRIFTLLFAAQVILLGWRGCSCRR